MDIVDKLAIEEEYDFTKEIGIIQGTLDIIKIMLDKKADKKYIRIVNYGDNF
jgi:hypothetical protein